MNREPNNPAEQAPSLEGIAKHHPATGDPTQGAAHLRQVPASARIWSNAARNDPRALEDPSHGRQGRVYAERH